MTKAMTKLLTVIMVSCILLSPGVLMADEASFMAIYEPFIEKYSALAKEVERASWEARKTGSPDAFKKKKDARLADRMLEIMMAGVSTRCYEQVLPEMAEQVGISKSAVSREFMNWVSLPSRINARRRWARGRRRWNRTRRWPIPGRSPPTAATC